MGTVGTTTHSRLVVGFPSWHWNSRSGMQQAVWLLRALTYMGWSAELLEAAMPQARPGAAGSGQVLPVAPPGCSSCILTESQPATGHCAGASASQHGPPEQRVTAPGGQTPSDLARAQAAAAILEASQSASTTSAAPPAHPGPAEAGPPAPAGWATPCVAGAPPLSRPPRAAPW